MVTNDRFLYCCGCNEVHKVTPFDKAPTYDLQGSTVREIPTDDRRRFMERHASHAIEELSSVAENWLKPQSAIDPMADSYVFVANERYFFLVHRSRRSIAEPIGLPGDAASTLAFGPQSRGPDPVDAQPARLLAA